MPLLVLMLGCASGALGNILNFKLRELNPLGVLFWLIIGPLIVVAIILAFLP